MAMSLIAPSIGLFLNFKNLSLAGDALGHALLPGVAMAYFIAGMTPLAIIFGGLFAGGLLLLLSRFLLLRNRSQHPHGDANQNLAPLFMLSTGLGVLLISIKGNGTDLQHLMFGSVLTIDDSTLGFQIFLSIAIGVTLWIFSKHFLQNIFDPEFFKDINPWGRWIDVILMSLVVLCLVCSFFVMGSLLALGIMIIPAAVSRLFCHSFKSMNLMAAVLALLASYLGLLVSFHFDLPSGPSIIVILGIFYILSHLLIRQDFLTSSETKA